MRKGKLHKYFFYVAVFLFVFYCYQRFFREDTIYVNIYDTYFVLDKAILFEFLSVWFALCGLGYWILKRLKVCYFFWLSIVHLILSLLLIVPIVYPKYFRIVDKEMDKFSSQITWYAYDESVILILSLFAFLMVQLLYFLNLLLSAIRKNNYRS